MIESSGRASIMLPYGTKFSIKDVLYSSKSRKNLLSFKDIHGNSYHIETNNEGCQEYLYITLMVSSQNLILEKLLIFSSGLYCTTIKTIEVIVTIHQKDTFYRTKKFFHQVTILVVLVLKKN
ncbi:hypothetical protein ACB092_07G113900 [Castanea dentata]